MNTNVKLLISICIVLMVTITAFTQPDSLWLRGYNMTIGNSMLFHDGDYVLTGYTVPEDTPYSIVTKIDPDGEIVWETTWFDDFYYKNIIETPDSGIAICGYEESVFRINKYNLDGEELYSWQFEYGRGSRFLGFLNDGEGGYIVAGDTWTSDQARQDCFLLKVSSEDEIEWERTYVDRPRDQYCYALAAVPGGGYMLVGRTREDDFGNEVNVISTNSRGSIIWQNHYGTEYLDIPANEGGYDIIASEDGNFIIVGQTLAQNNGNGHFNVLMFKIDLNGEVIWMRIIDFGRKEKGRSIEQTIDGGLLLSAYSSDDEDSYGNPLLIKADHRGNPIWSYVNDSFEGNSNENLHSNAVAHEDITFSLINGSIVNEDMSAYIQKFGRDPHGVADGNNIFLPSWTRLESAYPNPFNSITTFVFTVGSPADVEIDIFNGLGRRQAELVRRSYPVGQHMLSWDAGGLPSGDYFARMTTGGGCQYEEGFFD